MRPAFWGLVNMDRADGQKKGIWLVSMLPARFCFRCRCKNVSGYIIQLCFSVTNTITLLLALQLRTIEIRLQCQHGLQPYFNCLNFRRQFATIYIDHEVEQNPYEVTRLSAQPGKYFPSAEPALHMGRMSSKHRAQPLLHTATTKPILYGV